MSQVAARELDDFEGVHTGFYFREMVDVEFMQPPTNRETCPNPLTGKKLLPGDIVKAGGYFRGDAGPKVAVMWTIERLLTLPMVERYTEEHGRNYVPREIRDKW